LAIHFEFVVLFLIGFL